MADSALDAGKVSDAFDRLRLIRSRRVGPVTYHRLIEDHGSAAAALAALPDIARAAGVEGYAICPEGVVTAELVTARKAGARLLCHGEAAYPAELSELPDAPPILWVIGDAALLQRPMVAMVGARNASSLGMRMARRLAEGLGAAGFGVVSGMARGIDSVSHEAALASGTVAVLAGGVDVIYPAENAELYARLVEHGCVISEQPPGTDPQARHFPLRNRIVSGLAQAVVVVEAAARSGSLITARSALDQGRDVLEVPGHPFDARAAGCNMLIRDGARLVRCAQDVVETLRANPTVEEKAPPARSTVANPPLPGPVPERRPLQEMAAIHTLILDLLGPSPLAEDQLIRDLAMPSSELAPELLTLELEGRVVRQPGGLLARVG